jgi:hypothetical protein
VSRADSLRKLAAAYALHQLRRRIRRPAGNLARLLSTYADDGLQPVTADERRELPRFSRCINCGICGLVAGPLGVAHLPDLASAYLRSYPLLTAAGVDLVGRAADLEAAAAACPTGVPMPEVAAMILRLHSAQLST